MWAGITIFAAVMTFVAVVWVHAANTSGVLEGIDDEGLTIVTLLRSRIQIRWMDISGEASYFGRFLPRIVINVFDRRLRCLSSQRTVFLRGRYGERELIAKLRESTGLKES